MRVFSECGKTEKNICDKNFICIFVFRQSLALSLAVCLCVCLSFASFHKNLLLFLYFVLSVWFVYLLLSCLKKRFFLLLSFRTKKQDERNIAQRLKWEIDCKIALIFALLLQTLALFFNFGLFSYSKHAFDSNWTVRLEKLAGFLRCSLHALNTVSVCGKKNKFTRTYKTNWKKCVCWIDNEYSAKWSKKRQNLVVLIFSLSLPLFSAYCCCRYYYYDGDDYYYFYFFSCWLCCV